MMRLLRSVGCTLLFAGVLSNCSVVPPLEQATGSQESNIFIADIVQRVKCEIADSFHSRLSDPHLQWIRDWTLKADLTLQINTQAGVAPSGSYTQFQKNAFNLAAGSNSLTSNTISSVSQFFTVAVGANLGEQAVRMETVSFSLAVDELEAWRARIQQIESNPDFPPHKRICGDPHQTGLTGNLGLDEWISSAFYPVEVGQLLAGYHPAPGTSKAATSPGAIGPPKPLGGGAPEPSSKQLTPEEKKKLIKEITDSYTTLQASALDAENSIQAVDAANVSVQAATAAMRRKQLSYELVATNEVRTAFETAVGQLRKLAKLTATDRELVLGKPKLSDPKPSLNTYLEAVKSDAKLIYNRVNDPSTNLEADAKAMAARAEEASAIAKNAKVFSDHAQSVQKLAATITASPDPPIDSILHSVQFVVSYGASITPSWTLIQWKGPALNGPGASMQGVRTHILQIALGPRGTPSSKISVEQNRLIQNSTVLLTR